MNQRLFTVPTGEAFTSKGLPRMAPQITSKAEWLARDQALMNMKQQQGQQDRENQARQSLLGQMQQGLEPSQMEKMQDMETAKKFLESKGMVANDDMLNKVYAGLSRQRQLKKQAQMTQANLNPLQASQRIMGETGGAQETIDDELKRLESLYRSNNLHIRNVKQTQGINSPEFKRLDAEQENIKSRLKQLAPNIYGGIDISSGVDEEPKTLDDADLTGVNDMIKTSAVDSDNDGVIDNIAEIKRNARSELANLGIGANDKAYKETMDYIGDLESQFAKMKESKRKTIAVQRQSIDDDMKYDEKYKWLYVPYKNIIENPNDVSAKNDALMSALRKESGAAIAVDEFVNFMKLALSGENLRSFQDETNNIGTVMLGMANDGARDAYIKDIGYKYMDKADSNKVIEKIKSKIPDKYLERKGKESKKKKDSKGTAKPKRRVISLEELMRD